MKRALLVFVLIPLFSGAASCREWDVAFPEITVVFNDPNYNPDGSQAADGYHVDKYLVTVWAGDYTRVTEFARIVEPTNQATIRLVGSDALPMPGTYNLTVRPIQVRNGISTSRPPVAVQTVKFVPLPPPLPLPIREEDFTFIGNETQF